MDKEIGMTPEEVQDQDYNRQTTAVMERCLRRTSNCIDVGCHTGQVLDEMLRLAPEGQHFAFEPLPDLYAKLVERYPRVHFHQVALSDRAGQATFQHVVSNPGYSGLLRRRYDRPDEVIEAITVEVTKLDDVLPREVPIHFMKIDVEGGELQVLLGATRTIATYQPVIVFEHGWGAADYYGTTPAAVYDLLSGTCGLRLSLMERWLTDRPALTRDEFVHAFHNGNYYFMAYP